MKKNLFLRIVFYVAGLLILALGIILNTKSGLGVSPIISVAYSITTIGGFNFGNITFLLYSAFVVVEIVLHIFRNHRYSGEAGGAIAPAAHRDLKLVLPELDFFLEKKVPQVKFVDRTFNAKKSHAMAIWKHILEHDNGVTNFHFEITADLLDEEELDLISRMRPGLIQLEIGVQSTNPDTIKAIRRKMDLDRLRYVVERINAGKNVHQHLDLIAGLPFEDYDSFGRSFNDVYSMEPEQFQLGFLKVLKGSYMHEKVPDYDLQYRGKAPYEVLSTKWLPYSDVLRLKGVEDMVEVYYNSRQFMRTLKLFEQEFDGAFAMYEYMAGYYDEQHLTGLNHSRLARYEIFHDLISRKVEQERMSMFEDALMCDLYLRENAKSRPSFALAQAPYKEEIRHMVPELRTLGTQVHAEVLRSGEVLLFDYREKDRLNHNAKVTVLGRTDV